MSIIIITTHIGCSLRDKSCGYQCIFEFCYNIQRLKCDFFFFWIDTTNYCISSEHHLKYFYYVHSRSSQISNIHSLMQTAASIYAVITYSAAETSITIFSQCAFTPC